MSSNIRIQRICQQCKNEFTAKTTVTKYCSDRCSKRAYKARQKAEETKREFLTLEELKILAKTECENLILKKAFLFSALTGLRHSDIKALTWQDLQENESGHFIRFRQQKTKGEETLPIPTSARNLLGGVGKPTAKNI